MYSRRSKRLPTIGPLSHNGCSEFFPRSSAHCPAILGRVAGMLPYDRRGGPGVGSSLVGLPGSQGLTSAAGTSWPAQGRQPAPAPHLNCQRLRLEPVLQRTSGTPALRSQIMGAHGDCLDFPRGRCTSSWTLLGPEGTWWTSVRRRSKPQLVVRSERPLLRIRLDGPAGTGYCSFLTDLHSSDLPIGDREMDVPSAPWGGATHPRTDRLIDVWGIPIHTA